VRSVFTSYLSATAIPMLSQQQIGAIDVCVPPEAEQVAIVTYLDAETAKVDALLAKVERAIDRLLEYRTSLITTAVTGKIDVRGVLA
jgi:type I restriction enzyme S subunit